jgi:predicted amidohydrolase YtcJ
MFRRLACWAGLLAWLAGAAHAQPADTILLDGKIVTADSAPAEALATRGDRIVAIGRSADIRALAGPATRVIDLAGRTVIPGLIDSHIHAIRAGLTWATEVHWIGATSLTEALDRLRAAAQATPKGSWLVVAGGWIEGQFAERRRPTQAEIAAAAPDHHVYVQVLYSAVLLSAGGIEALGLHNDAALASRLKIETGADGRPTGWISADNRSISDLFDKLPRPTLAQQVAGTRAFFRTLNGLGITGVLDPGGYNMPIEAYEALFQVWRDRALTIRVTYSLCAPRRDHELADFETLTAMLPMGFGDDWLRFNGIGENVTWGMYNNDAPSQAQKEQLYRVLRWAAPRGLTATFHWHNNRSVPHLLDVLERVNREAPIAPLRWSVAHLNDASPESLARMNALGVGWLMQNAFYFRGEAFLGQRGADAVRVAPPIGTALRMGLAIGGGTDAHRVMSHNPFVSLQWMLDGKSVAGLSTRGPDETPTRLEALRIYTQGSAWFAHDDARRGSLGVGKLADLAVLTADYLGVPAEEIDAIRSLLTMVGGRIVYAAEPYAAFEDRPGAP